MMPRLSLSIALGAFAATLLPVASTDQSHLRVQNTVDNKKGTFSVMKGVKCGGSFDESEGGMKAHCEGGMKKEFSVEVSAKEMIDSISKELLEQIQADLMPGQEAFFPNKDVVEEMKNYDGDNSDGHLGLDDKLSIEYGGSIKVDWGCKMTFKKADGTFSKKVECGAKLDTAAKKKKPEPDEFVLDYFTNK